MIVCNFTFETTPDKREDFVALLTWMMHKTQGERGCVLYRYMADLENDTLFHLVENWESEDLMNDHIDSAHSREFIQRLPPLGRIVSVKAYKGEVTPYRVRQPSKQS